MLNPLNTYSISLESTHQIAPCGYLTTCVPVRVTTYIRRIKSNGTCWLWAPTKIVAMIGHFVNDNYCWIMLLSSSVNNVWVSFFWRFVVSLLDFVPYICIHQEWIKFIYGHMMACSVMKVRDNLVACIISKICTKASIPRTNKWPQTNT